MECPCRKTLIEEKATFFGGKEYFPIYDCHNTDGKPDMWVDKEGNIIARDPVTRLKE